ncbi:hypothetical protein BDQ12DRAFT_688466 [Crucibulum laeve]|uniref:Uncharacterized protein n=1 Tax=Crucibulum laeve TaxID=68775 RepID=A0A5C3LT38_9AGAR|nr:hypothetical protein BDQ12DRAFT_688466 [Crucibulum laeve]
MVLRMSASSTSTSSLPGSSRSRRPCAWYPLRLLSSLIFPGTYYPLGSLIAHCYQQSEPLFYSYRVASMRGHDNRC